MAAINDSSQKIAAIIKTIDDIAFQTNILALNAAVEAARAGQHGAGFAVVADEVRNLAQRSAVAAKDTAQLIEESVNNANRGAEITDRVGSFLSEITNSSRELASTVEEIAHGSKEQSDGVSEVTKAVSDMDRVTQQNASYADQLSTQAREVQRVVQELEELMGKSNKRTQAQDLSHNQNKTLDPNQTGFTLNHDQGFNDMGIEYESARNSFEDISHN